MPLRLPVTRPAGFTLLEILVVVVVIAVLAGAVTLRLRGLDAADVLDREARRLAALVQAQCEQAVLQARTLGLRFTAEGYDFWLHAGDAWLPLGEDGDRFRPRQLTDPLRLDVTVDGHRLRLRRQPDAPQVHCTNTGELTPFEAGIALGRLSRRVRAGGAGDIRVYGDD